MKVYLNSTYSCLNVIQALVRYYIIMWVYCVLTIILQKALLVDINTTAINQTRISARTTVCSASFNISA